MILYFVIYLIKFFLYINVESGDWVDKILLFDLGYDLDRLGILEDEHLYLL